MESLAALALSLTLCPTPLLAQGILHQWPAPPGNAPWSVAAAGDVDGDSFDDWATGEAGPIGQPGRLRVFSGKDASTIRDFLIVPPTDWGVAIVGLGDVNQDGFDDLAAGGAGALRGVSGANGATLWETAVQGAAIALANLGDVDSDGAADLAVGAVSTTIGVPGRAYVVSGRTGALLETIQAPSGGTTAFGRGVASVGDFEGDGSQDFAVGDQAAQGGLGEVTVFSSAGGQPLATIPGPATAFSQYGNGFGWSLASPGDVDGDGVPELLIGSPFECAGSPGYEGCLSGTVRLFSGCSGAQLFELVGANVAGGNVSFGLAVAAFEDLDEDGLQDLLIAGGTRKTGCCIYSPGDVVAVSSITGEVLLHGRDQTNGMLAVVPDVDGELVDDYLTALRVMISVPRTSLILTGRRPPSVACISKHTSEGCYPYFAFEGAPSLTIGPDLTLRATGIVPSSVGLVAWSMKPATTPFAGGTLCIAPPIVRGPATPTGGTSSVPCSGELEYTFSKAMLAAQGGPGVTLYTQAWFRDPGFPPPDDVGLTHSIVVTIWP